MGQEMGQKEIEREMMEESGKKMEQKEKVEQDEERIMGYRISDVVSCIGKQEDDYIRRFRKLREKGVPLISARPCSAITGWSIG